MNEQITQTMIQAERLIRKFKFIIIACLVLIVGYLIYDKATAYLHSSKINKTNEIYLQLLQNANPTLENELSKLNPNLYSIYLFYTKNDQNAALQAAQDSILKKIYQSDKNSEYLQDLEDIKQAYSLMKENQITKAQEILNNISINSPFYGIANNLKHYQGKN